MLSLCSFFRLKELFQVKNGSTKSFLFFFLKMPKISVGRTKLNGERKEDGLIRKDFRYQSRLNFGCQSKRHCEIQNSAFSRNFAVMK